MQENENTENSKYAWKLILVGYCVILLLIFILLLLICMMNKWADSKNDRNHSVKGDLTELKIKRDEETPKR